MNTQKRGLMKIRLVGAQDQDMGNGKIDKKLYDMKFAMKT